MSSMTLLPLLRSGAVLLLILVPLCSAARHEMFHGAHPLMKQAHASENGAAAHPIQFHDDDVRQWICSVHQGISCDQVVQSCSSSACSLVDALPPHSCIIYMNAAAARELLVLGFVSSTTATSSLQRPPSIAHPLLQLRAPSPTSALQNQDGDSGLVMTVRCIPGTVSLIHRDLAQRMQSACPLKFHVRSLTESPSFSVTVSPHCYHAFLHAAAAIPAVVSVFHREQYKVRNRWARGLVQSHSRPSHPPQSDATFWCANITGTGQVVAIGDTGVDTNLGFFYDEASNIPHCTDSSSCRNVPLHRRFKAYIVLEGGDRRDDDGHGSHTTASIAGNAQCIGTDSTDQQLYNGMAQDAKLVFSDISNDETLGGLPDNLATDYFPLPYSLGARVRSDSWGTSDAFYTESARDFDVFAFKNDEFLPLIAAGNDGDSGLFTIGAPATAKNCIAVGATGNAIDSYLFLEDRDFGMRVNAPPSPSCASMPPQNLVAAHPAGFGPKISEGMFDGQQIVLSSPVDACSPLDDSSSYNGKIVLIVRGTCTFVEKIKAASAAGAKGAVVYNNVGGILRMGGTGDGITIPSMSVTQEMGALLTCLIGASSSVSVTLPLPMPVSGDIGPEYVAAFSSLGPTLDGRLKPDLMAPGEYIFSAKANPLLGTTPPGYCAPLSSAYPSIKAIMGTSMATPTLAGAAVLLRQWLVEGRYPDGVPKQVGAMFTSPSGAMVKALLLGSALPLTSLPNQRTPNIYEGYGAAVLADAVPVPSSVSFSLTRGRLWADDRVILSNSFSAYTITFDIADVSVPLVATLVWWDAAVSIVSPIIIANDFDLTCFPPNGTSNQFAVYTGNGFTAMGRYGSIHQVSDRFNTNERVFIRHPSKGTYICVVTLERQLMSGSSFAVVITGGFSELPVSKMRQGSPCTNNCINGYCNAASRKLSPSACECYTGWTGIVCDIPVSKLSASSNESVSLPLASETWQYFWFIVPPSASSFSVTFARLHSMGDPDFYVQQGIPPSVSSFVVKSTQCDSCSPQPLPPAVLHVDSAGYKNPLPGLWFAGVFASCCNASSATVSLRATNAICQAKGPNYVLGCDDVCVEIGSSIVDYDSCGVCGGNSSSCIMPFVPNPPPSPGQYPDQPGAGPESETSKNSQELKGGAIGAITVAVIYYVFSACVSLFVFCRVRGSVRPVRLRVASFLWCLFGFTGAHRFYTKHTITGFIWLFTCGLCGIGWIVDLFLLRRMISRYNVHGSRLPKFFQGMRNRLRNRVGKNRYRKTINFADDEISLDQSDLSHDDGVALENVGRTVPPKIFDGSVEVSAEAADDGQSV